MLYSVVVSYLHARDMSTATSSMRRWEGSLGLSALASMRSIGCLSMRGRGGHSRILTRRVMVSKVVIGRRCCASPLVRASPPPA